MMLSFAVFSVFASLKLAFTGFPLFAVSEQTQYLLIGAVFLLSVLGAIGAGIMPRLMRLGGLFLLLSCIGVAALLFAPVVMQSFSFAPLEAYGIYLSPLMLLIADYSMGLLTAIGLLGGILAFIPKRDRKAESTVAAQPAVVPKKTASPPDAPAAALPDVVHAVPPAAAPSDVVHAAPPAAAPPDIVHAAPPAAAPPDIVQAAPPAAAPPDIVQAAPPDAPRAAEPPTAPAASPLPDIDLMNLE
jgi:hypothetical protein